MRLNKTGISMYFSRKQKLLPRDSTPQQNKNIEVPWKKTYVQIRNLAFCSLAPNLQAVSQE